MNERLLIMVLAFFITLGVLLKFKVVEKVQEVFHFSRGSALILTLSIALEISLIAIAPLIAPPLTPSEPLTHALNKLITSFIYFLLTAFLTPTIFYALVKIETQRYLRSLEASSQVYGQARTGYEVVLEPVEIFYVEVDKRREV